jgi:hypothetical protein
MKLLPKMPGWPISETRGEPITAFGREITPVGRVFQIRWPRGSFIRHRPVAIEVREGDVMHRLPIPNPTRRITTALTLTAFAVAMIGSLWVRRAKTYSKGGK